MIQIHKSIPSALQHAGTWAGFAGVFGSLAPQLDKPYSLHCFGMSALCSLVAIVTKSPSEPDADKEEGKPDA